jgi:hypothetical protein
MQKIKTFISREKIKNLLTGKKEGKTEEKSRKKAILQVHLVLKKKKQR